MITIEEAQANIGRSVVYRSAAMREGTDASPPEDGVITGVSRVCVFVRYGTNFQSAATYPEDLDWQMPDEREREETHG